MIAGAGQKRATAAGRVPGPQPGDGDLVPRLRRGEAAAFDTLARRHGPRLLAVCRRLMKDEEEARDALQDAFIQVLRSIGGFSGRSLLGTWLHRVTVNACLMRLRARRRRPEVPLASVPPAHRERALGSGDWDPTGLLVREHRRRVLWACIRQLPAPYRAVLVLRDLEDRDTRETASLLGTTGAAVKVRLHRARRAVGRLVRERSAAADGRANRAGRSPRSSSQKRRRR